jgi:YkoY family integral membrane protein
LTGIEHLFTAEGLTIIGTLILLEGLLSADNALVMAVMVRPLPKPQQKRALYYGILGAFFFRFLMLATAHWIIKLWYLRAAGAAYLAWLTFAHFRNRAQGERDYELKKPGFWYTVIMVNLMDCAFAIDSVLVAVGLSNDLIIIFVGVALGIVAVRVAAGGFLKLLEKWPAIEDVAYILIGWISIKLFVESYGMMIGEHIEFPELIFWAGMGAIAIFGTLYAIRKAPKEVKQALEGNDPPANSA